MICPFIFDIGNAEDCSTVLEELQKELPDYFQESQRLRDIFSKIDAKNVTMVTMVVEQDYIDKQYRDSYYMYFSQKYNTYERNCVRLSLFEGILSLDDFLDPSRDLDDSVIGTIVLRPLRVGNIGTVLLSPSKLSVKGYFRKCTFKIMVYGRKIHFDAFPFSSQDVETMSCAENALFNLIKYYGRKYPEYREIMPSEILQSVAEGSCERVLPSNGLYTPTIAKVLSDSLLYPRIYSYGYDPIRFKELLYIYIESGIPLLIGLPGHIVSCIGHGSISQSQRCNKDWLKTLAKYKDILGAKYFYLGTSDIYQTYIVMDDNKPPYHLTTVDDLVKCYADSRDPSKTIEQIKEESVDLIVPIYKRIFIDAAHAMQIFKDAFLYNPLFIEMVRDEYTDQAWGADKDNPFVWRVFLTTSKNYKAHKMKTHSNLNLKQHYMLWSMPHFIWVLEIGTMDTYIQNRARIEVIVDASSSHRNQTLGILSVRFRQHYVYIKDGQMFTLTNTSASTSIITDDFLRALLVHLSNTRFLHLEDEYEIFSNSNLKGNL